MADKGIALTTIKGGINRQRVKGAALNDSLYDLLNGYVTKERTVVVRPGTFREAVLPNTTLSEAGDTHGLTSFNDSLHVFAVELVTVPDGFHLHVIQHPAQQNQDGSPIPIRRIHFAAPFLGFLYVVAEFEVADPPSSLGNIFHFWLHTTATGIWQPNQMYKLGDVIEVDGIGYIATRVGSAFPSWSARAPREVGDKIEPTVYNDLYFEVIEVSGATPSSGDTEPSWPTSPGATVIEYSEKTPSNNQAQATPPPTVETPGEAIETRYWRGVPIKG